MRVKSSGFAVHFFKRRITQILLILFLFLVGVTAGAVCRNMLNPEIQERLSGSFLSFFTSFGQVGVGTIFQNTLSNLLQQVGLAVIFTLTLTGVLLLPVLVTKTDKLSAAQLARSVERYKQVLGEQWEELPPMFRSSSEKRTSLPQQQQLNVCRKMKCTENKEAPAFPQGVVDGRQGYDSLRPA